MSNWNWKLGTNVSKDFWKGSRRGKFLAFYLYMPFELLLQITFLIKMVIKTLIQSLDFDGRPTDVRRTSDTRPLGVQRTSDGRPMDDRQMSDGSPTDV